MSNPDLGKPELSGAAASVQLAGGRKCYHEHAWRDAYVALTLADREVPLGPDDLQLLAASAYMIGREEVCQRTLERSHRMYLEAKQWTHAARDAFWIGLDLFFRGESGPAAGWFGRAQRLVDRHGQACAEEGYLLLPRAEGELRSLDPQTAHALAAAAAELGERFAEPDLIACARHVQGRALLQQGQAAQGLALLDETMVAVTGGELSPRMTGLIYCSVIDCCMHCYAYARAREWTFALSSWCEEQPQLVSFAGACLVHRAEIMQLRGAWPDAMEEANRACSGFSRSAAQPPTEAFYRRGELHRLRGEFEAAEEAFRDASNRGLEPQPGLALLRQAQGKPEAAAIAIRRVLSVTSDPLRRADLLSPCVEIMLASGDIKAARDACRELEEIAGSSGVGILDGMAAHCRGAVALADGDATAALFALRQAADAWQGAEAPYQAARARELGGLACRALGDEEGAVMELGAAIAVFQKLGAAPDVSRVDSVLKAATTVPTHGLTNRELQVLRLVAAGKTNKLIANELFVSQRTIDRHLSNIFVKIDVTSRAGATTYAHRHNLV